MVNDPRRAGGPVGGPELTARQVEDMLAEFDAMCRQARELSTQITRQMAAQREQDRQVASPVRFPMKAGTHT
jgi:hypothetical protein